MAGYSCVMFGWSWIEVIVLGSQVFGQASMDGYEIPPIGAIIVMVELVWPGWAEIIAL